MKHEIINRHLTVNYKKKKVSITKAQRMINKVTMVTKLTESIRVYFLMKINCRRTAYGG